MIRRRKVATDKLLLNFHLETDTDSYIQSLNVVLSWGLSYFLVYMIK